MVTVLISNAFMIARGNSLGTIKLNYVLINVLMDILQIIQHICASKNVQ